MIAELSNKIKNYLNSGPNRNLNKLAKITGVSYVTLHRIMQCELKAVSLETAISILSNIVSKGECFEFIEEHFASSATTLKSLVEKMSIDDLASVDMCDAVKDYNAWFAVCLAERSCGAKIDEIGHYIGIKNAESVVSRLVESGVMEEKSGSYFLNEKDFTFSHSLDAVLSELRHFTYSFDRSKTQAPGHCLASFVHGFNQDGLNDLKTIMREAAFKIADLTKDPTKAGNTLAFSGVISGVICSE